MTDHELARELAVAAGQRLLALRSGPLTGDRLRDAGDRLSQEFLAAELARARPADAVLSEEGPEDAARLTAQRVWIVDPLDGTREFGAAGRTDWAVHVALWERGRLTAGAVALPAHGTVLATQDSQTPQPAPGPRAAGYSPVGVADEGTGAAAAPLRIVVSRSRPAAFLPRLAEAVGGALVPMGSAGAKAAAVIRAEADAYVHDGGLHEWDSAAPVAVARAAGLHASGLDGAALEYNRPDPWQPGLLICPVRLAGRLLAAVAAVRV